MHENQINKPHQNGLVMIKQISLFLCCFIPSFFASSGEIRIAVASNFKNTAQTITDQYSFTNDHKITLISGSSSALFSMIYHGAPIDIFLSADKERPLKLIKNKLAKIENLTHYADGQLVFLSPNIKIETISQLKNHLKNQSRKLAIANVRLAPYGASSLKFIEKLGVLHPVRSHLIAGNNVAQAMQFIISNNAGSGFVSYSQIKQAKITEDFYVLPKDSYPAIQQYGILTNKGAKNPAATDFMSFLVNNSQMTISDAGYLVGDLNDQ